MMLATRTLRVALATTHLPLKDISSAITQDSLTKTLTTLNDFLKQYLVEEVVIKQSELPHLEEVIYKDKRAFNMHAIIFADKTFEVVIRDITKTEKQKKINIRISYNVCIYIWF